MQKITFCWAPKGIRNKISHSFCEVWLECILRDTQSKVPIGLFYVHNVVLIPELRRYVSGSISTVDALLLIFLEQITSATTKIYP